MSYIIQKFVSLIKIRGNTDDTLIGNVVDRLKVDAQITSTSASGVAAFSAKLRYNDMNASTGGVARGTTIIADNNWIKLYEYIGSGLFTGISLGIATANSKWNIRLVLDSTEEIFGSNGLLTDDVDNFYGLAVGTQNVITTGLNIGTNASFFFASSPTYHPTRFTSKIQLFVRREVGTGNKLFNAGLIVHTKDS